MHGDLREYNFQYTLPLTKQVKVIVLSAYSISGLVTGGCLLLLLNTFFLQKKISLCSEEINAIDFKIQTLNESIVKKNKARLHAEKIIDWTKTSIPIQPLIVEILNLMPLELKIKNISAVILPNRSKLELVIDVLGKKQNSLLFAKKVETLLNSRGHQSSSSYNIELVSGNRIIISSLAG